MPKPILLIQLRDDESQEHEKRCIIKKTGLKKDQVHTINITRPGSPLPRPEDLKRYSGVITGASSQIDITQWTPEYKNHFKKFAPFLKAVINQDFPMLSICFGHQFIATILEGRVEKDPQQSETGTYQITLTRAGQKSSLFKGVPKKFAAVSGHKESVTNLPKKAILLASSARCKLHAYRLGNNVFSVQFHPELDLDGLMYRLALYPEYLKGKSLDEIRAEYMKVPYTKTILQNFKNIVGLS